jgi:hypothetical protein
MDPHRECFICKVYINTLQEAVTLDGITTHKVKFLVAELLHSNQSVS